MNEVPNYTQGTFYYEPMAYPPYYYQPIVPYQPQMFLRSRMTGPKLATTLRTAQKTINTASRIIPAVYQMQPVISNAKTAFKVAKAMKSINLTENDPADEAIDVTPVTKEEIINKSHNPYIP